MLFGRHRHRRRPGPRLGAAVLLAMALSSCSVRPGVTAAGALAPPDGTQMAETFVEKMQVARRAAAIVPVRRDPALDQLAQKGMAIVAAGLPESETAGDRLENVAGLPPGLTYVYGFEGRTPGVDERIRAAGERDSGIHLDADLVGADPALDALGWASSGPWFVSVLRARRLTPVDGPKLQAVVEAIVQRARPGLHPDPKLGTLAAQAVVDGELNGDDLARFAQAGGVPVKVWDSSDKASLPSTSLISRLADRGRAALDEAWLTGVGAATKVTDGGTVHFVVLATGEADRAALAKELQDAEPMAVGLVNKARAEAALPPVRLDATLVDAARRWLAGAAARGCYVGFPDDPGCPGAQPAGADAWRARQATWSGAEDAYDWYLAPATDVDHELKRFGAAATLAPDGTLWSMVVFAR